MGIYLRARRVCYGKYRTGRLPVRCYEPSPHADIVQRRSHISPAGKKLIAVRIVGYFIVPLVAFISCAEIINHGNVIDQHVAVAVKQRTVNVAILLPGGDVAGNLPS